MTADTTSARDDREIAYHEAGHAVLARHFGLSVKMVSIAMTDDWSGVTRYAPGMSAERIQDDDTEAARLHKEHLVCVALAGYMAGKRASPDASDDDGSPDRDKAIDLLFVLARPGHIPDYEKHLRNRTDCLLDSLWHRVKAVAQALLERETLSKKELLEVIEDANRIRSGLTPEQRAEIAACLKEQRT